MRIESDERRQPRQARCDQDRPGNCSPLAKCGAQPRKAVSAPPRGSRQPMFRPFRPCLACWNGARSPSEVGIRGISAEKSDKPEGAPAPSNRCSESLAPRVAAHIRDFFEELSVNRKYDAERGFFQNKRILGFCAKLAHNWFTTHVMVWALELALSEGQKRRVSNTAVGCARAGAICRLAQLPIRRSRALAARELLPHAKRKWLAKRPWEPRARQAIGS
jgi:hypothetical protein